MRVMSRHAAPTSPHPIGWPSPEAPGRGGVGWPGDLPTPEPGEDDAPADEPAPPQGLLAA
jgi:hypothetical protein